MARVATILFFVSIWILAAAPAVAAPDRAKMDDPFEITADEINFDGERRLYVADRRVRVVQGDRSLRARWVAFSTETRIGVAEGDVELIEGENRLNAQFMVFNVDTLRGTLYQGELDAREDGFYFQAKELIRTGNDTFTMRDALFTTCLCEEDERVPWALSAADADVELGGYGTMTNSTFDVLGVPVLWIPWIFFPVKAERETGFLLPDFEFGGRGGIGVGLPFFWAAHPQLNVTLTPRYYSDRGYKQDAEFEYVFGKRSQGELFVAGLHDSQGGQFEAAPKTRWAVLWNHDQELPEDWRWQTDLRLSSDNLYADDFNEMREYSSFRFIESTTNIARDFGTSGSYGAMVAARYADDVQGSRFVERDEYLIQRFAEVRGDVLPGAIHAPLGLDARFDSELIYFSGVHSADSSLTGIPPAVPTSRPLTTNGRFYDLGWNGQFNAIDFINQTNGENDGIFQEGEPLSDRGARVILHPRVSRSFQLGGVAEIVPEVGWQQTLYKTEWREFAERGLFTARTDLRTRLVRDYESDTGRLTRHILEPRLSWAMVSQRNQRNNPLFVPRGAVKQTRLRTLSLESVIRDPSDRTDSVNQVVLALGQRWFSSSHSGAAPGLKGDLVTAIDWDFDDGNGLGTIVAEGRIFPVGPFSGSFRSVFDPEAVAFEEGGAQITTSFATPAFFVRRWTFWGGYSYLRRPPRFFESDPNNATDFNQSVTELNQVDFQVQVELAWRIRLTYGAIYELADDDGGLIRNRGMIEYVSKCKCWGAGVRLDYDTLDGVQGGFMIRFIGLGDERSNIFDGGLGTGVNL